MCMCRGGVIRWGRRQGCFTRGAGLPHARLFSSRVQLSPRLLYLCRLMLQRGSLQSCAGRDLRMGWLLRGWVVRRLMLLSLLLGPRGDDLRTSPAGGLLLGGTAASAGPLSWLHHLPVEASLGFEFQTGGPKRGILSALQSRLAERLLACDAIL